MSLFCAMCGKEIVMSDTPTHFGVCAACPTSELTETQKELIKKGFNV